MSTSYFRVIEDYIDNLHLDFYILGQKIDNSPTKTTLKCQMNLSTGSKFDLMMTSKFSYFVAFLIIDIVKRIDRKMPFYKTSLFVIYFYIPLNTYKRRYTYIFSLLFSIYTLIE